MLNRSVRVARSTLSLHRVNFSMDHYGADTAPREVKAALKQIYLRGKKSKVRPLVGQPRVVACITGGGGQLFSDMLRTPGASSCLLEGLIPYDKESCLSFLGNHNRRACVEGNEEVGFCSADMAALLAESARDRALQLTPRLVQWPDCIGVSLTATIISHYQRKGPYRIHAGACHEAGGTSTYSHVLVKGARDRAGEDGACALLALRALATAAGAADAATDLATYGIRQIAAANANLEPVNNVGERAEGVEQVPVQVDRPASRVGSDTDSSSTVYVPNFDLDGMTAVGAPRSCLPKDTIISVSDPRTPSEVSSAFKLAAETLHALGRLGDVGQFGNWASPAAPVLFYSSLDPQVFQQLFLEAANNSTVTNWAVLSGTSLDISTLQSTYSTAVTLIGMSADTATDNFMAAKNDNIATSTFEGEVSHIDDGSPSTIGVKGIYSGDWNYELNVPHGKGVMTWENGISYNGSFCDGMYHGLGSKLYSRGGGYAGEWRLGRRHGSGTSFYDGKFGYDRWEGNFRFDKAHGEGTMYVTGTQEVKKFAFINGDPVER